MSEWTPESKAAHRARLEIIDKLGWGPSSIAGPDYIVSRIKLEKQKLELQIEELKKKAAAPKPSDYDELRANLHESNRLIERMTNSLNKIHDLAGQISGPNSHPNVGAIQDWVHQVLPCEEKQKSDGWHCPVCNLITDRAGLPCPDCAVKRNCVHKWAHIEDHHVICEKCKHPADLCWTCESEKTKTRDGVLVCLKCNPQ